MFNIFIVNLLQVGSWNVNDSFIIYLSTIECLSEKYSQHHRWSIIEHSSLIPLLHNSLLNNFTRRKWTSSVTYRSVAIKKRITICFIVRNALLRDTYLNLPRDIHCIHLILSIRYFLLTVPRDVRFPSRVETPVSLFVPWKHAFCFVWFALFCVVLHDQQTRWIISGKRMAVD